MKMRIKQLREDEKGSGLVLTLMVLLVLSVLGIAIGTLAIGSYRLSNVTRDDTSAYYIAEAGAVAAYEEVQKKVLDAYKNNKTKGAFYNQVSDILTSKNGNSSADFGIQFGSKPSAIIRTEKVDAQNYAIHSTGEVDGKERTVTKPITVNWVEKNTGGGGFPRLSKETALLVDEKMKLYGGELKGNAYIQSIENKAVQMGESGSFKDSTLHYSDKTTPDKLIEYKDWFENKLPNLSTQIENINFQDYKTAIENINTPDITKKLPVKNIGNHLVQDKNGNLRVTVAEADQYKLNLESNVYIPEIESNSQRSFSINTGGANYTILTDHLDVGGDIQVNGGGTVTIFIKKTFNINSGGITFNKKGTPNKLVLVYLGDKDLKLENDIKINGHLLVKKADVDVKSISINGVLLTGSEKVELSGGGSGSNLMLIAPNAEVSLKGSYSINGSVVAKIFKMDGGAKLIYAPVDTTGFPFGSSGTTTDPKPEDIISSGIIKED